MRHLILCGLAALALVGCNQQGGKSGDSANAPATGGTISGAGATFPAPLYAKWAETYKGQAGVGLNYQAIGSGGGIKQIKARTVDFGASDKPMKAEELQSTGLFQFPTVIGGVVPVINAPGVQAGQIKLSGPVLASIFLGEVTKWSDPRIAQLNAGAKLPNLPITVVHRSDGSGTSFQFTSYLAQVSPAWKSKVGASDSVEWPVGLGGKGNDGVAAFVKQTPGSIGYVEYAFAKQNGLAFAQLQNASGQFVSPNAAAFAAAAAGAPWATTPGYAVSLLNQSAAGAWPISGATFILLYKDQAVAAKGKAVLSFFDWAYSNGDAAASGLDYVPLPAAVKDQVRAAWKTQITSGGKPVYAGQ